MAMIPVTYLSGASTSNTLGMFKRGTIAQNLKSLLESGFSWWSGIDIQSNQYLIYSDTYTMGTTTQANAIPVAWSTPDLTDTSLLNLINTLPPRVGKTAFTSLPLALQWLQTTNQFFLIRTGTENIVKSGLKLYVDAGRYDSYSGTSTTWRDLSGSGNNGTLTNGTSYNTSGVGSMVFDGTDDYVNCGNNITTTNQITVSAWVKLNVNNIYQHIVDSASNTWHLAVLNDGRIYFWDGAVYHTNGEILSTGKWYHVVGVKTATTNDVYVNGVLSSSLASDASVPTNNVWIGRWQPVSNGRVFNGNISNVQIYDNALSPQQILQNFNTQKYRFGYYDVVQSGLTLNLDATNYLSYPRSGTTWTDLTGNDINGSLENSPTFSGGTSPSIVFDGSDDYVNLGTTLNNYIRNNLPFTLETVVYLKTSNNNEFFISNSWDDPGIHIRKRGSTHAPANGIRFLFIQDGNNGCGKDSLPLDTGWYHLVGTYNGQGIALASNYQLYINASTGGTSDVLFGTPSNPTPTNAMNIGRSGDATNYGYFNGNVGIANFYNIALTPQQVYQNYYKFSNLYPITGITTNGLVLNLDAANTASYGGSGTLWKDISSSGTDGTLTNGPSYVSSGVSSSILFDGSDDYVKVGNPESLQFNNATFSYGCWFYWTNTNTIATLMGKRDGSNNVNVPTGSNYNQYNMTIAETMCCGPAGKKLGGYISCDGGSVQGGSLIADLPNNVGWVHAFITINTTEQKLYLNGVLSSTTNQDFTGQTFKIVGRSFYVGAIGGEFEGSIIGPFNNKIASAQVYNRTLSASEVLQNYNAQKSRFGL